MIVFLLGHFIFLLGIEQPPHPYFDEIYYIPAAKQLLRGTDGQPLLNSQHPPLAKQLMALGIAIWGDTPLGWRYMSAVFGALTLVGVYLWAIALLESEVAALWAVVITLADQLLYIQSRIAMLDVFALAFAVLAMAAFAATWRPGSPVRRLFAATGVLLGLGAACKWTGLVPWAACIAIAIAVGTLRLWGARLEPARGSDWYRPGLWQEMRASDWILCLGILPISAYLLPFVPLYGASPAALAAAQADMWAQNAAFKVDHPYMSAWTSWPLLERPIWYLWERAEKKEDVIRAVLYLGNPIVLWSGVPAILVCLWDWLVQRRRDCLLICMSYLAFYLAWALVPQRVTFLYYYFPAAIVMSLALAHVLYTKRPLSDRPWTRWLFLALSCAWFVYFLPMTSAAVTASMRQFDSMMWFAAWR